MLNFNTDEDQEEIRKLLIADPVKIPKNNNKIIISMTSGPLRLRNIPVVLNLLDLSCIDEIHINLPKLYRNEKEYKKEDIEFVKGVDSRIKIFRIDEDIGPMTKIIPTLQRIKDPKTIIISIDDDIGYPFNLISSLIARSIKKPNEICTGAGFVFGDYTGSDFNRNLWPRKKAPTCKGYVDIVEGWGSIAYKKSIISNSMINEMLRLNKISKNCKLSDDFTISYVLASHGIKCYEIPGIRDKLYPFGYGEDADALHKDVNYNGISDDDANMPKYHMCLEDIGKEIGKERKKRSRKKER
jgi:hypothetical protein